VNGGEGKGGREDQARRAPAFVLSFAPRLPFVLPWAPLNELNFLFVIASTGRSYQPRHELLEQSVSPLYSLLSVFVSLSPFLHHISAHFRRFPPSQPSISLFSPVAYPSSLRSMATYPNSEAISSPFLSTTSLSQPFSIFLGSSNTCIESTDLLVWSNGQNW